MKLLHVGITEAAAGAGIPLLPGESNWTDSTTDPPTGWFAGGGTVAYSSTGAYSADVDGTSGVWLAETQDFDSLTLMVAYNLTHDNWVTSVQLNDIYAYSNYRTFDDTGSYVMYLDQISPPWSGSGVSIDASDPEGFVVLAGVLHSDGLREFYRFDDNGAVTVGSDAGSAPGTITPSQVYVTMQNYDFSNDVPGTPGSIRIARTYVTYEAHDLSFITNLATTWGWS